MDIQLIRVATSDQGTFGVLIKDNIPLCLICERPWLENQSDISCIPNGIYQVEAYSSPKFPKAWEIQDVPDRSDILIHNGNTEDQTHGCLIVGNQFGEVNNLPAVLNSNVTLYALKRILPDNFTLEITSTFQMS